MDTYVTADFCFINIVWNNFPNQCMGEIRKAVYYRETFTADLFEMFTFRVLIITAKGWCKPLPQNTINLPQSPLPRNRVRYDKRGERIPPCQTPAYITPYSPLSHVINFLTIAPEMSALSSEIEEPCRWKVIKEKGHVGPFLFAYWILFWKPTNILIYFHF